MLKYPLVVERGGVHAWCVMRDVLLVEEWQVANGWAVVQLTSTTILFPQPLSRIICTRDGRLHPTRVP